MAPVASKAVTVMPSRPRSMAAEIEPLPLLAMVVVRSWLPLALKSSKTTPATAGTARSSRVCKHSGFGWLFGRVRNTGFRMTCFARRTKRSIADDMGDALTREKN
jgi:hypothetical protein